MYGMMILTYFYIQGLNKVIGALVKFKERLFNMELPLLLHPKEFSAVLQFDVQFDIHDILH